MHWQGICKLLMSQNLCGGGGGGGKLGGKFGPPGGKGKIRMRG